jgi:SAM-dependent methyltransferase
MLNAFATPHRSDGGKPVAVTPSGVVLEIVDCPDCSADAPRPIIATRDYETAYPDTFQIVECGKCGLAYTSPRPTFEELLSKFYGDTYLCYNTNSSISKLRTRLLGKSRVRLLDGFLKSGGRFLDVGCANGDLLKYLADGTDWDVHGCEPQREVAAAASSRGLNVVAATLRDAGFPGDYFDVVFMSHVIEHLPDIGETIEEVFRILKPGGVLITENPDFSGRTRRFFGRAWWAYHLPRHLTHFTPDTECRFLGNRGFAVLSVQPCFRPALLAWSIQNWIKATGLPNFLTKIFGPANPAFVLLMFPLEYLNLKRGRTDVILVVAKKPATAPSSGPRA